MAYSTSAPPRLLVGDLTNQGPNIWTYIEDDTASTAVDASGYITNGYQLGMKAGDIVIYQRRDTYATQLMIVVSVNSTTGAIDLSDGTAISNTDSD